MASAAASARVTTLSLLQQLIAHADSVPTLSFAAFKRLWSAYGCSALHVQSDELEEQAERTTPLNPVSRLYLRNYFRSLVDMLVDAARGGADAAPLSLRPSVPEAEPEPLLHRCVYIIFALYTLWATQPRKAVEGVRAVPAPLYPLVPIRVPQVHWDVLSRLLTRLSQLGPTLHGAHVLARMLQDNAFEMTLTFPRREAQDVCRSLQHKLDAAGPFQLWRDDEAADEDVHAAASTAPAIMSAKDAARAAAAVARKKRRLASPFVEPSWRRNFRSDFAALESASSNATPAAPVLLEHLSSAATIESAVEPALTEARTVFYQQMFTESHQSMPVEVQLRAHELRQQLAEQRTRTALGYPSSALIPSETGAASSDTTAAVSGGAPVSALRSVAATQLHEASLPVLPTLPPFTADTMPPPAAVTGKSRPQRHITVAAAKMQRASATEAQTSSKTQLHLQPQRSLSGDVSQPHSAPTPNADASPLLLSRTASGVSAFSRSASGVSAAALPCPAASPLPASNALCLFEELLQMESLPFASRGDDGLSASASAAQPPSEAMILWQQLLQLPLDPSIPPAATLPVRDSSPLPWMLQQDVNRAAARFSEDSESMEDTEDDASAPSRLQATSIADLTPVHPPSADEFVQGVRNTLEGFLGDLAMRRRGQEYAATASGREARIQTMSQHQQHQLTQASMARASRGTERTMMRQAAQRQAAALSQDQASAPVAVAPLIKLDSRQTDQAMRDLATSIAEQQSKWRQLQTMLSMQSRNGAAASADEQQEAGEDLEDAEPEPDESMQPLVFSQMSEYHDASHNLLRTPQLQALDPGSHVIDLSLAGTAAEDNAAAGGENADSAAAAAGDAAVPTPHTSRLEAQQRLKTKRLAKVKAANVASKASAQRDERKDGGGASAAAAARKRKPIENADLDLMAQLQDLLDGPAVRPPRRDDGGGQEDENESKEEEVVRARPKSKAAPRNKKARTTGGASSARGVSPPRGRPPAHLKAANRLGALHGHVPLPAQAAAKQANDAVVSALGLTPFDLSSGGDGNGQDALPLLPPITPSEPSATMQSTPVFAAVVPATVMSGLPATTFVARRVEGDAVAATSVKQRRAPAKRTAAADRSERKEQDAGGDAHGDVSATAVYAAAAAASASSGAAAPLLPPMTPFDSVGIAAGDVADLDARSEGGFPELDLSAEHEEYEQGHAAAAAPPPPPVKKPRKPRGPNKPKAGAAGTAGAAAAAAAATDATSGSKVRAPRKKKAAAAQSTTAALLSDLPPAIDASELACEDIFAELKELM